MTPTHSHSFILSIDETARIVRDGRTLIAICTNQVIRAGHPEDVQRELEAREKLPLKLRSWCPEIYDVIRGDDCWAVCEAKHARSQSPEDSVRMRSVARKDLWRQEEWYGTLGSALRRVRPHRPLDYKKWAHSLKLLKQSGVAVPIPVRASKIRQIFRRERNVTWHRGWVHGGLLSNRIRGSVFLCWRNANSDGQRGEDTAQWLTPEVGTDPDILIHIIKAVWQTDPLRAAQALYFLSASDPLPPTCFVSVNAHKGLSSSAIEKIIGCSFGEQLTWKAARALYRTRNLQIGGVPINVQTQPEIQPRKDDAFFLQRKRRPQDLFSLYGQGIQLDEEGRYSLTPERHALKIAGYFQRYSTVFDSCCGCGGNAIAFARSGLRVVAMDSEPIRLSMARHNARVYGVEEKIQFVNDRFPKEVEGVDGIFLDPPWSLSEKEVNSWWEWAETHYSNGMIKLPKNFPVPQHRSLIVFHSLEGYPSFVLVGWGDLA